MMVCFELSSLTDVYIVLLLKFLAFAAHETGQEWFNFFVFSSVLFKSEVFATLKFYTICVYSDRVYRMVFA